MNIWTIISLILIVSAAIYYTWLLSKLGKVKKSIEASSTAILEGRFDSNAKWSNLVGDYFASMQDVEGKKRTNMPADYYINEHSLCVSSGINLRLLDTASGTLVGLGLLGTFLGLTVGIAGFDSSSTDTIQQSIQSLLSGMATAFLTSLVGMFLSLFFTFFLDKPTRNKLDKTIRKISSQLDAEYYIDDVELNAYWNKLSNESLEGKLKEVLNRQTERLDSMLHDALCYNKDGENIPVINLIREIHTESTEQTKALKSFSTDLAIELNNGFDEMLSRQLQSKLIPLMESVDRTTKVVIEHIDKMAESVKSPADSMVNSVVGELKTSIQGVMQEFKSNISDNTMAELEGVAKTLGDASSVIMAFPTHMENITRSFYEMMDKMRHSVEETTQGSVDANADSIKQMQEQLLLVSKTIGESMDSIRTVMSDISSTTQQSNSTVISQMETIVNSMASRMTETTATMGNTLSSQLTSLSDNLANHQMDMLALQEDSVGQIKALLSQFTAIVEKLGMTNTKIGDTLGQMEQVHGHISDTTSHLRGITAEMNAATSAFHQSQADYTASVLSVERTTKDSVANMNSMLTKTGEISEEYLEQFGTLKDNLGSVFAQIQQGLNEYSQRVRETTSKYIQDYSSALTNTVDQINNTVGEIRDIVEMLEEQLSKLKK